MYVGARSYTLFKVYYFTKYLTFNRQLPPDSKTGESDISIWANGDFSIWRLQ